MPRKKSKQLKTQLRVAVITARAAVLVAAIGGATAIITSLIDAFG